MGFRDEGTIRNREDMEAKTEGRIRSKVILNLSASTSSRFLSWNFQQ